MSPKTDDGTLDALLNIFALAGSKPTNYEIFMQDLRAWDETIQKFHKFGSDGTYWIEVCEKHKRTLIANFFRRLVK